MDLGAFVQISDIENIATANNITVPRLRGYRLMDGEDRLTEDDIESAVESQNEWEYKMFLSSVPAFSINSNMSEFSPRTERLYDKYLITENRKETLPDGSEYERCDVVGFRWNLLHGKKRKLLKLALKRKRRRVLQNLNTFNKYVGRKDVLYIHARIGGKNWVAYGGYELEKEPWFLEKVDDYFDSTYCDIYAKIDRNLEEHNEHTENSEILTEHAE